jgi:putative addiction module killer protein
MEFNIREARFYVLPNGRCPFEEWLNKLKDIQGRAIIRARIRRLELGNPGSFRPLGNGIFELKINFGPGYRVYYGEDGPRVIILLCGGNKSSQTKDIEKSYRFWTDFRR